MGSKKHTKEPCACSLEGASHLVRAIPTDGGKSTSPQSHGAALLENGSCTMDGVLVLELIRGQTLRGEARPQPLSARMLNQAPIWELSRCLIAIELHPVPSCRLGSRPNLTWVQFKGDLRLGTRGGDT